MAVCGGIDEGQRTFSLLSDVAQYILYQQVLRKYPDKTVARDLVRELESYNGDPSNLVMSGEHLDACCLAPQVLIYCML